MAEIFLNVREFGMIVKFVKTITVQVKAVSAKTLAWDQKLAGGVGIAVILMSPKKPP